MTTKTNNAKETEMSQHTKEDAENQVETYFMGDRVQFTGETEVLYGKLFGQAVVMEGRNKGETVDIAIE